MSRLVPLAALAGVSLSMLGAPAALAAPPASPGNSAAAKACQNGGFARFQGTNGSRFTDEGGCVRYVAQGGALAPMAALTFVPDVTAGYCDVTLTVTGAPNTAYYPLNVYTVPLGYSLYGQVSTDANGFYSSYILPEQSGSTIFVTLPGVSLTSPVTC